jgi:hypothetical protein
MSLLTEQQNDFGIEQPCGWVIDYGDLIVSKCEGQGISNNGVIGQAFNYASWNVVVAYVSLLLFSR